MKWFFIFFALIVTSEAQELKGHGGPVRALLATPQLIYSGSFDQSIMVWDKQSHKSILTMKAHEGAVNGLAIHHNQLISAGDDGKIIWWHEGKPQKIIPLHDAAITSLISHRGDIFASSWDHRISITGENTRYFTAHKAPVSAVAAYHDDDMVSIDQAGELILWNNASLAVKTIVKLQTPLTALLVLRDGRIILGASNGQWMMSQPHQLVFERHDATPTPIISMALSGDEKRLVMAAIGSTVSVIDLEKRKISYQLQGSGLPLWSVVISGDEIITGGGDGVIRRWDLASGEHKGAAHFISKIEQPQGDRGAELFRACAFCHSFDADGGNKAGPSLRGVVGRKSGAVSNYHYSQHLLNKNIIWTRENIKQLFKQGPNQFIGMSKMPEQRITDDGDLEALVRFIERNGQ